MKSNYWMKLYFEILHDPKMSKLSDRQWRRTIELFLLAGEHELDGSLPPVEDIAWQLRTSVKALEIDLSKIAEFGIVSRQADGTWVVTNFEKRNAPVTGTERIRNYRVTKRNEEYQSPVTERYTSGNETCNESVTLRYTEKRREDTDKNREDTDTEKDQEGGGSGFSEVYKLYDDNVSRITPHSKILIDAAVEVYSEPWVKLALEETIKQSKHAWSYADAILKRWKDQGFTGNGHKQAQKPLDNEARREIFKQFQQSQGGI